MAYQDELTKATQALTKGLCHLKKEEYAEASAAYKEAIAAYDEVIKFPEAKNAGTLHEHITDNMSAAYYNLAMSLNYEKKFHKAFTEITDATTKGIVLKKVDELKGNIYHNLGAHLYQEAQTILATNPQKAFNLAQTILNESEIKDAKTQIQACSIMWQAKANDPQLDIASYLDKMKSVIDTITQAERTALAPIVKYISSHVAVSYLAANNTEDVKAILAANYVSIDELRSHVIALKSEKTKVEALIDLARNYGDATSGGILGDIANEHRHPELYDKALLGDITADEVLASSPIL